MPSSSGICQSSSARSGRSCFDRSRPRPCRTRLRRRRRHRQTIGAARPGTTRAGRSSSATTTRRRALTKRPGASRSSAAFAVTGSRISTAVPSPERFGSRATPPCRTGIPAAARRSEGRRPRVAPRCERLSGRPRAGVFDRNGQLTLIVRRPLDSGPNRDVATDLLVRDPMLHGVFDERLKQQRRKPDIAELAGTSIVTRRRCSNRARSMSRYDSTIAKLASERREFAFRAEDAPQQCRQTQQCLQGARRRSLNQIPDRGQRVEQEVWIDLGAKRAELGFRRELADFLFAKFAVIPLVRDPNRVDPARHRHRDGFQRGDIVRQQASASTAVGRWRSRYRGCSVVASVTTVVTWPGNGSPPADWITA